MNLQQETEARLAKLNAVSPKDTKATIYSAYQELRSKLSVAQEEQIASAILGGFITAIVYKALLG